MKNSLALIEIESFFIFNRFFSNLLNMKNLECKAGIAFIENAQAIRSKKLIS
jgi:hypothetical protein